MPNKKKSLHQMRKHELFHDFILEPSETPIYNYINPALRARPTTCLFPYNKRNSSSSTPEPPIQSPPYISISSTSQIPVQSSSKTTIPSPQNIVPENNQPSLTNIGYIRQNDPGIGFQRESFITMPVKGTEYRFLSNV